MFGTTFQLELIRTDASKYRKIGAKLEVCLCFFFVKSTYEALHGLDNHNEKPD